MEGWDAFASLKPKIKKEKMMMLQNDSKVGRPSKRSVELEQMLFVAISKGLPLKVACDLAGIAFQTFCEWRREFPDFSDQVKKAEAEAISRHIQNIENAAMQGSWKASTWILERRHPDLFGKTEAQREAEAAVAVPKQKFQVRLPDNGRGGITCPTETDENGQVWCVIEGEA